MLWGNGVAWERGRTALHDLTFRIGEGESVGVIGPNGAGKSTVLKVLGGVTSLTHGVLTVNGTVGVISGLGAGFCQDYSGVQNIRTIGMLLGWSRDEIKARLPRIVEFSELGSAIHEPLRTYSTGMQARLGFSIMTELRPSILAIDEAFTVGDNYFSMKCIRHLEKIRGDGTTLILVSHNLFFIRQLCDKVIWLEDGRIVAYDKSALVCDSYEHKIQNDEARNIVARNGDYPPRTGRKSFKERDCPPEKGSRIWKKIAIERVEILGPGNEIRGGFLVGERLVIRIYYVSTIEYARPNVGLTIEREDGLVVASSTMHDHGCTVDVVRPGTGCFDAIYDPIVFGPAHYSVHASITLDDPLALGDTNFDYAAHVQAFRVWTTGRTYAVAVVPPLEWHHRYDRALKGP